MKKRIERKGANYGQKSKKTIVGTFIFSEEQAKGLLKTRKGCQREVAA